MRLIAGLILLLVLYPLVAQESDDLLDADLSSLFGSAEEDEDSGASDLEDLFNDLQDPEKTEAQEDESPVSVLESLTSKIGYTFQLDYAFTGGMAPGWGETPWNSGSQPPIDGDRYTDGYTTVFGADIGTKATLDLQLTGNFRVKQVYALRFPEFEPSVEEFWGAYNFKNVMTMRMGLQNIKWGLGRNYSYTNILTRLPADVTSGGESFSALLDIPVGLGGFQLIALARSGFSSGDIEDMTASDVGYGLKYNHASQFIDMDLGTFFHQDMPLRTVLSLSSTLWNRTEVYAEALWAADYQTFAEHDYSFSIGFFDSFFKNRLYFNAEYYWNGEENVNYVDDDEGLIILDKKPFLSMDTTLPGISLIIPLENPL